MLPESAVEESIAVDESTGAPESVAPLPESTVVIEVSAPVPESIGVDVSATPESVPLVESGAPPLSLSGLVPLELLLEQACVASTMAALAAPTIAVFFQLFIGTSGARGKGELCRAVQQR